MDMIFEITKDYARDEESNIMWLEENVQYNDKGGMRHEDRKVSDDEISALPSTLTKLILKGQHIDKALLVRFLNQHPQIVLIGIQHLAIFRDSVHDYGNYGSRYFGAVRFAALEKAETKDEKALYKNFKHWEPIYMLDELLDEYPQLKACTYGSTEAWGEVYITRSEGKGAIPNIERYAHDYKTSVSPFFLNDLHTLRVARFPRRTEADFLSTIYENNPNLVEFQFSWRHAPSYLFEISFDREWIDPEFEKKYLSLVEEFKALKDPGKKALLGLLVADREVPFEPETATILALINGSNIKIRRAAIRCFDLYFNSEIDSLEQIEVWLAGKLPVYKNKKAKELLALSNSKLSYKCTPQSDLLVVGQNAGLESLDFVFPLISSIAFERLLERNEQRTLVNGDNSEVAEKLSKLFMSEDQGNVKIGLKLVTEGGIPPILMPILLALAKVNSDPKIRKKSKDLIKRHGGDLGRSLLSICERKNYLVYFEDSSIKKDVEKFREIEGFDTLHFLYCMALWQRESVGKDYLLHIDSDRTEELILRRFDVERVSVPKKASPRFSKAKQIRDFRVGEYDPVVWDMGLRALTIHDVGSDLEIPSLARDIEAMDISGVKELSFTGVFAFRELRIAWTKSFELKECAFTHLEHLKIINVKSRKLDLSTFISPKLKSLYLGQLKKVLLGIEFSQTKNLEEIRINDVKEVVIDTESFYVKDLHIDAKKLVFKHEGLIFKNLVHLSLEGYEEEQLEAFLSPTLEKIILKRCAIDSTALQKRFPGLKIWNW